ncbi:helicase associated domain-containing protein [Kitasatospora sp. NPDC085895]|uniref:helicase associated domain-containing protein n=1 Tax=Kitasatospora sp. NPDC085895 TaxID=3155057 RepID=UPI00344B0374
MARWRRSGGGRWRRSTRSGAPPGRSPGSAPTASRGCGGWSPTAASTGRSCPKRPCSRASSSAAGSWRSVAAGPAWRAISRTCSPRSASRRTRSWWRRRPRLRSRRRPVRIASRRVWPPWHGSWSGEGHARVPRAHKEPVGAAQGVVALGVWVNNQRARRDKLSDEQRGQLEALGVAW